MTSSNVIFDISYAGSYNYQRDWNIVAIDLQFTRAKEEIFAYIDTKFKVAKEQLLEVRMRTITGNRFVDLQSESIHLRVSIPLELAKTIKLSVRIFQAYENDSRITYPDGSVKGVIKSLYNNVPVSTRLPSKFEAGTYYRIKVVNEGNRVHASFIPMDAATARAEFREQDKKQDLQDLHEMSLINQGIAWPNRVLGVAPGRGQVFQGLPYLHQAIFSACADTELVAE